MTVQEATALIVAASTLLTAMGTLYVSLKTNGKVAAVATAVDGHTERLVALTAKASFAEGLAINTGEMRSAEVTTAPSC